MVVKEDSVDMMVLNVLLGDEKKVEVFFEGVVLWILEEVIFNVFEEFCVSVKIVYFFKFCKDGLGVIYMGLENVLVKDVIIDGDKNKDLFGVGN